MQNLLIIDNDISYIQHILSNISQSITNIKLYKFYMNKDENIYADIVNNDIDIIVFSINLFKTDLIEFIYQNNIAYYKKSIIVLYNNMRELENLILEKYNKYVFKCEKKSDNLNNLIKTLNALTYIKETNYNELVIETKVKRTIKKWDLMKNTLDQNI